ncbi:hypothetical protein PPYR_09778 [Photinus pyralis]|uniref:DUF4110 domain-containing protein n=1 Tax=Photinus pyralis TaxID=7054 RepID=A0A1Y1KT73_PHOPY|nr:kelch domain-containing protein 4 [Photinus pyralis]KAB0795717.1 hypothetical protein PPYR_09778 [Photinus pyralis]
MGKKDKNKKKGKGAEKTAAKTEKKESNKLKKNLAKIGEEDIEKILADIESEERKKLEIKILKTDSPRKRINFTFAPHPDKDELILFGGEYFNGQKTFIYNDLFFYNIHSNTWTLIQSPAGPPPRCGHQMVTTSVNKGQLWVFGGEYASPTQSQFYHYKDLWVFHLNENRWEKIGAPNGPSSRSGHRMVYCKKQIFVFGGFHDNLRDYKYYNDIHIFSLETYQWTKLEPTGKGPAPRSGCCMLPLNDGKILIYGGYSKEKMKKDVDKGIVFADAFLLVPDKNDASGTKWKWVQTKLGGVNFSQRSGMGCTLAPNNVAYTFGGVFDVEEEEDISSTFYNDFFMLELNSLTWRNVAVGKKKDNVKRELKVEDLSMEVDEIKVDEAPQIVADDGIFTVTVGPSVSTVQSNDQEPEKMDVFKPSPRMNCGLTVKHGMLYIFGGMVEDGDKQLTMSDFYSLDLKKLDKWKVLVQDEEVQEWLTSDSESESEDGSRSSDESDMLTE